MTKPSQRTQKARISRADSGATGLGAKGGRGALVLHGILSLLLLYHLATVVLLPNASSVLARRYARLLVPYANLLGLNSPWQFFSPGPAPTYFLEYTILKDGESLGAEADMFSFEGTERHFYPPPRPDGSWSDGYNRGLFSMRYFTLVQSRLEDFFVPWLCRQHPGALELTMRAVFEQVPAIDKAAELQAERFNDIAERIWVQPQRFRCPEAGQEVGE